MKKNVCCFVHINFLPNFHAYYERLSQRFCIQAPTLTLLKNILATLSGTIRYQTNLSAIFTPIIN